MRKRFGSVIKAVPEMLGIYKQLHANPWKDVCAMIKQCNIENYVIYYRDGYLFSHYEYVGDDYEQDMSKMADDPVTQDWWKLCRPCQKRVDSADEGEWWADMEEVFYLE